MNKKGPKTWQLKNREKAYNGSIQHFMSSLYNNRLAEQGFEVKRLFKTPNLEKERIKKIYREHLTNASNSNDSSAYYERVLKQPDMLETYGKDLLIADSLVATNDSLTKKLFFTDYLYVVYKNEKKILNTWITPGEKRPVFYQRSVVFELNNKAVFMDTHGNYFMPTDFMSYGYWGWNEKISNILPLDYR